MYKRYNNTMNLSHLTYRHTKKLACFLAINHCPYSARKLMVSALDNIHHLFSGLLLCLLLLAASRLADWIAVTAL